MSNEEKALDTRIRILRLRRRQCFRFIDQPYLAKKLKRSVAAVSYALNGNGDKLLDRIITHLDYLERKEMEKRP